MTIFYPVAANPEAALSAPLGRAAREREARGFAKGPVVFETRLVGPAFSSREAALDAYAGKVIDDRPGRLFTPEVEHRFCQLVEVAVGEKGGARALAPVAPTYENGRRWPVPPPAPRTAWRLTIGYWRVADADEPTDGPQARLARRKGTPDFDRDVLSALTRQPLRAVRPQQALDIGLFETRLPEAPHIIVPDE
jgi:hypothetical protein